jgi:hypothetical protein
MFKVRILGLVIGPALARGRLTIRRTEPEIDHFVMAIIAG